MTLFKLSLRNIRKSFRDYAIYFFTLTIGVAIFYVFNSIGSQAAMLKINERGDNNLVELLTTMLSGVSVFVAAVMGLLIVYASRFLMKRRNREFALYLILGMGKGKISAILLLETLLIGIFSLAAGLLLGIAGSQFMSALTANLFEADMSEYKFTVSGEAIIKTIICFFIMYAVIMVFNSVMVSRFKIIDLIHSGSRSERIKFSNPVLSVITFIIAVSSLGYAYKKVTSLYDKLDERQLGICILIGAVSTFLIFRSVSGMVLRIFSLNKNSYFRGLNCFTFRQISSRINTMVGSMSVICLMLFVTICSLSSAFSIRNSMNANINDLCPADIEIEAMFPDEKGAAADITEIYKQKGYDITDDLESYRHFYTYKDKNFTFAAALQDDFNKIKSQFPFLDYDSPFELIRLSDYNALMQLYGKDQLEMSDSEYIVLCNFKMSKELLDQMLYKGREINIFGNTLRSKYGECVDGAVYLSVQKINVGMYIVPDSAVKGSSAWVDHVIGNYKNTKTDEQKLKADEKIRAKISQIAKTDDESGNYHTLVTRQELEMASIGLGAIVTFIGLYIGLVFLIACGAILALKELSGSVDSVGRYEMLRKIGVSESDIYSSLFRQTGIFFLMPMAMAVIHSIFGMKFATTIIAIFGVDKMGVSIAATSVLILLIYGGYFLITYYCSKGIISQRGR